MKAITYNQAPMQAMPEVRMRMSTVAIFFFLALLMVAFQNCGRASLGPMGPTQSKLSSGQSTGTNANGGGVDITIGGGHHTTPTPTPTPSATPTPTATPVATPSPSPTPVVCNAMKVHFKGEIDIKNPYGVCMHNSCKPKVMVDQASWVVPQLSPGDSYEIVAGPGNWYHLKEYAAPHCDNTELYGTFKVSCSASGKMKIVKVGVRYFSALTDYSKYQDHGGFNWSSGGAACTTASNGSVTCNEGCAADFHVETLTVTLEPI